MRASAMVCIGTGVIVLLDQIGRYWLAILPLEWGNRAWRLASIQLLGTQATPALIAIVLIALGLILAGRSLRSLAMMVLAVSTASLVGVVLLATGTGSVLGDTTLPSPENFRRASIQATGSLLLAAVIGVLGGIRLLRLSGEVIQGKAGGDEE